jgi:hypothetical protein
MNEPGCLASAELCRFQIWQIVLLFRCPALSPSGNSGHSKLSAQQIYGFALFNIACVAV